MERKNKPAASAEEKPKEETPEVTPAPALKPKVDKIRWRKIGGGSLRLKIGGANRIIKPNETFNALISEIPAAFRDTVVPVDDVQAQLIEAKINPPIETPKKLVKPEYSIKPRGKSKSMFDIVDGTGKIFNEKPLSKASAEQMLNDIVR